MNIDNYIKPELLVLIPVLYAVGAWVKASAIASKWIPLILGGVGVALAGLWVLATSDITGVKSAAEGLLTAVVQGVLCAAGAVYGNQLIKQAKKDE